MKWINMRAAAFLIGSIMLATSGNIRGELIAYDGIDYPNVGSDVSGNAGGTGFAGGWMPGGFNASLSANFDIGKGSLSYQNLATSGNRITTGAVSGISGVTRGLTNPVGQPGSTTYISFLMRPEGILGQGQFSGFFGVLLEQTGDTEIFAGKPGGGLVNEFVLENRGGSNQIPTGIPIQVNETYLMVLKSEFRSGTDTFSLFVNPTPGAMEPATPNAVSFASLPEVQGLTLYSTGAFSVDEFRVGETFLDVVPVPEPTTWVFVVGVAAACFMSRREVQ
jgi:hypothetical protein